MIAGKSCAEVRDRMFPGGKVKGTRSGDLMVALNLFGIKTAPRLIPMRTRCYRDLPFDAILKVGRTKANRGGHWVVWDASRQQFLDPWIEPYQRLRVLSYLEIVESR